MPGEDAKGWERRMYKFICNGEGLTPALLDYKGFSTRPFSGHGAVLDYQDFSTHISYHNGAYIPNNQRHSNRNSVS